MEGNLCGFSENFRAWTNVKIIFQRWQNNRKINVLLFMIWLITIKMLEKLYFRLLILISWIIHSSCGKIAWLEPILIRIDSWANFQYFSHISVGFIIVFYLPNFSSTFFSFFIFCLIFGSWFFKFDLLKVWNYPKLWISDEACWEIWSLL